MLSFLALYRGDSVATAELIAVSNDSQIISGVADALLKQRSSGGISKDPISRAIVRGKKTALRLVKKEAEESGDRGDGR